MKKNSRSRLTSPSMQGRKERLELLLSFVRISRCRRRDLVPRFALEWGLSEKKVQEYVRLLLAVGQIQEAKDGCLEVVRKTSLKGKSS